MKLYVAGNIGELLYPFDHKYPERLEKMHFEALAAELPEFFWDNEKVRGIDLKYEYGTEEEARVLGILKKHGCKGVLGEPWAGNAPRGTIPLTGTRVFEFEDLEAVDWYVMKVWVQGWLGTDVNEDGILTVVDREIPTSKRCAFPAQGTICAGFFQAALKKEDFLGLKLLPVYNEQGAQTSHGLKQLWSEVELPPLASPGMVGEDGKTCDGKREGRVYYDDPFRPPVLKYHRQEFEACGDFDIAVTYENLNSWPKNGWRDADLIVSRRMREWVMKQKHANFDWWPVQLID